MEQEYTIENFKNLQKGDVLVTEGGNEQVVVSNSDNTPDKIVKCEKINGAGKMPVPFSPTSKNFIKIIKNHDKQK